MRVGSMEGSPEEIKGLIELHGGQLSDYLERPEAHLARRWLIIPASLVVATLLLIIVFAGSLSPKLLLVFLACGFGSATWLTGSVQIRFRNGVATFAVAVGIVLTLLVAAGLIAPSDTINYLKNLRQTTP